MAYVGIIEVALGSAVVRAPRDELGRPRDHAAWSDSDRRLRSCNDLARLDSRQDDFSGVAMVICIPEASIDHERSVAS